MLSDHAPDEELFPIEEQSTATAENSVFQYTDPALVSGVLKGVVSGNLSLLKKLVESGKSININDNHGNTPLHVAVHLGRLDMVEFLLTSDELVIDNQNFIGETALHKACSLGQREIAQKLIEKGANVNVSDTYGQTPLHCTVNNPKLGHLLIENGANPNAADSVGNMPLHYAILGRCIETVCMLLYHNAEPNVPGDHNFTPFLLAIVLNNDELRNILVDFLDEVDAMEAFYTSMFSNSDDVVALTHTIMSYDVLMFDITRKTKLSYFIHWTMTHGGNEDVIMELACAFLMYGYQLTADDILLVYKLFGFNELMKIFLYMDFEDVTNNNKCTLMPFLLCCLDQNNLYRLNLDLTELRELEDYSERHFRPIILQIMQSRYGRNATLPKVPSLLDLAKHKTIKHIIKKKKIKTVCQYYTYVDHLNIAQIYRKILKHESRIYNFQRFTLRCKNCLN